MVTSPVARPLARAAAVALVALAGLAAPPASAQIPGLGRLRDAARGAVANPAARLLEGEPPITTSIDDAVFGVDAAEGFAEAAPAPRALAALARTPNGGFVLEPGYFEMHTQSYCLKAGTHGPGGGDGYLFAPPMGPAEDAVVAIVRGSVNHPEIAQRDIQVLLWAIIARAKFEDLDARLKATAARLLTPRQLAALNRNALDLLPGGTLQAALARMPAPVRMVFEAEAQLRQMLTSTTASFDEMERVAVLAGMAPMGPGSREVQAGRWSRHPDGYFVRYLPEGYSHTLMQVWVPEGSEAVGRELDPALHIAVPGNTARQRLIQSARPYGDG